MAGIRTGACMSVERFQHQYLVMLDKLMDYCEGMSEA